MADGVLPTSSGDGELRKHFLDYLVDLREGQPLFGKSQNCAGDKRDVGHRKSPRLWSAWRNGGEVVEIVSFTFLGLLFFKCMLDAWASYKVGKLC